jgi:hypothetical protein
MPYDNGPGYNPTLDTPANPSSGPDNFMGPGMDNTPFGYVPQLGVTDPTTQQELAREYGFGQSLNAGMIGAGPQFVLNQNARDSLATQIGYLNANNNLDQSALQNDTAYQLSKLGLQGEGLDLQRANLGIDQGANARQGPLADLLHAISGGRFDLSRTGAWQQADVANRQLTSQDIARGSITSIGHNQGLGDISNQLANQLKGIDYSQLQEGAQYGEQKAGIEDNRQRLENQGKQLDLAGKNLGLDRQHLNDQLTLGLQRMGIQNADAVSQLLDKMNSSSIQDQILAQQIFNQAIQNSDYYAQFYPVKTSPQSGPATPSGSPVNGPIQPGSAVDNYVMSTMPNMR